MTKRTWLGVVVSLALAVPALATDKTAEEKLKDAKANYEKRPDLAALDAALKSATEAIAEAEKPDLKYDAFVMASQVLYSKGAVVKTDAEKVVVYEAGYTRAGEAKALNPEYADAYFWYAANLGRWGEANGIVASLKKKKELVQNAETIAKKTTRDGKPGEEYQWYGSDRILGRMYFKLPPAFGGSTEKALAHLEKAVDGAKDMSLNIYYYAEVLFTSGEEENKAKAKTLLDDMLKQDPKTFNPARVPETIEEFDLAKELRKKMGQ